MGEISRAVPGKKSNTFRDIIYHQGEKGNKNGKMQPTKRQGKFWVFCHIPMIAKIEMDCNTVTAENLILWSYDKINFINLAKTWIEKGDMH